MTRFSAPARLAALCLSAFVLSALGAPAARADGWGTVKGKVTYAGDAPERPQIKVEKDPKECLRNGPLLSEELVVDKDTKGVRWVVVWLLDKTGDIKAEIPVHPDLKAIANKEVVLDQPCCMFEPHIVCLREGQTLVVKNSGGVPHNTKIDSIDGPSLNPLIPPGGDVKQGDWVAASSPSNVSCNIHPWMKAYVRCFKTPYFAVTNEKGEFEIKNAPAGKFNIVVWQESVGYLTKNNKKGEPIEIKADGVVEKNVEMKPAAPK
jgi:hypothetical protein